MAICRTVAMPQYSFQICKILRWICAMSDVLKQGAITWATHTAPFMSKGGSLQMECLNWRKTALNCHVGRPSASRHKQPKHPCFTLCMSLYDVGTSIQNQSARNKFYMLVTQERPLTGYQSVSYTHLTLLTIYSV